MLNDTVNDYTTKLEIGKYKLIEDWVCLAISVKNYSSVHGYSWYSIVTGKDPNLPSILVNKPLKWETISQMMSKYLIDLHKAFKAFIASVSSEKIKQVLCKKIGPSDEKFVT